MRVKVAVAFVMALLMAIAFATATEPEHSMELQSTSQDLLAVDSDASIALATAYDSALIEVRPRSLRLLMFPPYPSFRLRVASFP
jgi:hypothetical protein